MREGGHPVIGEYWDKAEFPFALVPKLAELNIMGGTIEGYGCPGMSEVASGLVAAELARGDGSLNTFYGGHSALAVSAVATLGSEEQKERWLPPMTRLEKIGAFGLTEARHGSDAVMLETSAPGGRRVGHRRGEASYGNASFAGVTVIFARDEEGNVGGFLVEKGTPGFSADAITGKTAKRAVWQAEIKLEGVRVPVENRLSTTQAASRTRRRYSPTPVTSSPGRP